MRKIGIKKTLLVLMVAVFAWPAALFAAGDSDSNYSVILSTPPVSPTIIREMEKAEVAEYDIKIKNNFDSGGNVGLYPLVYEVGADGVYKYYDDQSLNRDSSLAKWIDFKRSVIELGPGQEDVQKLRIRPSPDAKEGAYQAVIILSRGSTQLGAAEAAEKYNEAKITINLTIKAHIIERAEISEFKPVSSVLTKTPLGFSLKIKNIGNRPISPKGDVLLYTKNGKELSSVSIGGQTIQPNQIGEYPVEIKFLGTPGRYKVKFLGEYGEGNKDLQDIIYVLYLPAVMLTILIVILLSLLGYLAVLINRRKAKKEGEHNDDGNEKGHKGYVINLKK